MRYIVMTTAMAFIGGLFTAGLVLAAAEPPLGISSPTEAGQQQQGTAAEMEQPQQQVTALQMDGKQVRALQNALNEKGFAVGAVDGIVGPKTAGAIRDFQSKEGLTATGQPDQQTLKALGIEGGQQEYMGVSPEFGEEKQLKQPKQVPMQPMEQMEKMPMQQMEQEQQEPVQQQQPQDPGTRDYR